jgi:hypothetical protein
MEVEKLVIREGAAHSASGSGQKAGPRVKDSGAGCEEIKNILHLARAVWAIRWRGHAETVAADLQGQNVVQHGEGGVHGSVGQVEEGPDGGPINLWELGLNFFFWGGGKVVEKAE